MADTRFSGMGIVAGSCVGNSAGVGADLVAAFMGGAGRSGGRDRDCAVQFVDLSFQPDLVSLDGARLCHGAGRGALVTPVQLRGMVCPETKAGSRAAGSRVANHGTSRPFG